MSTPPDPQSQRLHDNERRWRVFRARVEQLVDGETAARDDAAG